MLNVRVVAVPFVALFGFGGIIKFGNKSNGVCECNKRVLGFKLERVSLFNSMVQTTIKRNLDNSYMDFAQHSDSKEC